MHVHVYLNFNCFQIISLITPQAKIDSLQRLNQWQKSWEGTDNLWTVPPKRLMGSAGLTVLHHVGIYNIWGSLLSQVLVRQLNLVL